MSGPDRNHTYDCIRLISPAQVSAAMSHAFIEISSCFVDII